jgi:hypothetical protein
MAAMSDLDCQLTDGAFATLCFPRDGIWVKPVGSTPSDSRCPYADAADELNETRSWGGPASDTHLKIDVPAQERGVCGKQTWTAL